MLAPLETSTAEEQLDQNLKKVMGFWYNLRHHKEQARLWYSPSRYDVVPAGRRSGKTEIVGKRRLILRALRGSNFPNPRYFAAAPTRDQVKRIYWNDLKQMIPRHLMLKDPSESKLIIYLINTAEIHLLGMNKPERVEGSPWDGGVLDEYANMKKQTWYEHVRPALSDRKGWCDFIGVPEGRNHYYDIYRDAKERFYNAIRKGKVPNWNPFWWKSADILDPDEIAEAMEDLDELTYRQEYEASFVNFAGMAYYNFTEHRHCAKLDYNPKDDLEFVFDFNVSPGVAGVVQEQWLPTSDVEETWGCGVIGEVYIPKNSNTIRICDKLIADWGEHEGNIFCYGDSTGGSKGTAKVKGTDWQLIKRKLWNHFGRGRVFFHVPKANPRERDRVNSVNSRLLTLNDDVRFMVDPGRAPWTVKDFEGTKLIEGGTGEIDKSEPELTHLTDAHGYRLQKKYPIKTQYVKSKQKYHK